MSDDDLRQRIMELLVERVARNGGVITRDELSTFDVDGSIRRLIDTSRGIWNPKWMDATLSILSSPNGPYDDEDVGGGFLRYAYRAGGDDGDNKKLRRAMELQLPIILLRKLEKGLFIPIFPVFVVHDDRRERRFLVALDTSLKFFPLADQQSAIERRYAERIVRQRLHQPEFRARVVRAYATRCAMCGLRHAALLDAAHIIADAEGNGDASVRNGLSLCKIHHAAYDRNFVGITRERRIVVRADILDEEDGPVLRHGIQGMNDRELLVPAKPNDYPDPERLQARFEKFKRSA